MKACSGLHLSGLLSFCEPLVAESCAHLSRKAKYLFRVLVLSFLTLSLSCDETASRNSATVPVYTFEVVESWPHDPAAFTQGLEIYQGSLYESTGLYGSSSLRQVELQTGRIIRRVSVPSDYFAEGITVFQGKIYQLTWQSHKGFIYDLATFQRIGEFAYNGEGWGLTHDNKYLIMSDGTNRLRFIDPISFETMRTISVNHRGEPLNDLNELEYIKGEIYANIWQTDRIVRLDRQNGKILGWIDLGGLLSAADRNAQTDVLNGIAYDDVNDRLFVTGKQWPKLFQIRLKKQ